MIIHSTSFSRDALSMFQYSMEKKEVAGWKKNYRIHALINEKILELTYIYNI